MKSKRIPLWFGVLKIRHREQLLFEERHGKVPVWAVGNYCLAWWAHGKGQGAPGHPKSVHAVGLPDRSQSDRCAGAPRERVIFAVAMRGGKWTIQFEGDYFGPCSTKEAAIDAAYLMAVDAAAKGFDPQVQLQT